MAEIWQRLRQRKMAQWALAYVAGAWVLLQVLGLAVDSFEWPRAAMRVAFGIASLGFVVALVLAWYHGERGQQKVGGTELLILALLLAVGGGLLWQVGRQRPESPSLVAPVSASTAKSPAPSPTATPISAKSIAVLPFVNMSADKENEYFSDGLSETLLNMLAQVPDLKVAGRTSSFAFKGKNEDLRSIGAALGVANVLEGSVQKAGETVRITAQLIAVSDGTHRWSKSYDRKLDDVFKIQDEIATAVVGALRVALQADERAQLTLKRTDNIAAYQEYLKGLALMPKRKIADLRAAAKHFERAIELDPGFARAYVGAADTYLLLEGYDRHDEELMARVKRYADRAMELSPTLGEAHATLGFYLMLVQDLEGGERELKRAIELSPGHASAYLWYASHLRETPGRGAEALAASERAAALEPLSPVVQQALGISQAAAGLIEKGRATVARVVRQFPDFPSGQQTLAGIAASEGDLVGALRAMRANEALEPESIPNGVRRCVVLANFGAGEQARACLLRYAALASEHRDVLWEQTGMALAAGDAAQALALAERSVLPDPFGRMSALLNLQRAPEALVIARQAAPEYLTDPPPEIGVGEPVTGLIIGSILLHAGEQAQGRALLERVLQASDKGGGRLEAPWPWSKAVALSLLGRRDEAIASLKQTVAKGRFVELRWLDADVNASGLRNDPRYEATVAPARARAAEQVRLAKAAGLL